MAVGARIPKKVPKERSAQYIHGWELSDNPEHRGEFQAKAT